MEERGVLHMTERLLRAIDSFGKRQLAVIGDVMLDRFCWGAVTRISPEAPVPVVRIFETSSALGGAANTALNVTALGGTAILVGAVGKDAAGEELRKLLSARGISFGLTEVEDRPTTTKTRVIAQHQQVLRIDEESTAALEGPVLEDACRRVERATAEAEGVIISDYAKGFAGRALVAFAIETATRQGKPVLVDPKGADASKYRGATILKPNRAELSCLSGLPVSGHDATLIAGRALSRVMAGCSIVATESEDGMSIFEPGGREFHLPTSAKDVYDVTGAGDTVIATLALAMAGGLRLPEAARLANLAAGIVVGQVGTAAVTAEALRAELTSGGFGHADAA
jgi:D-beta-D-heptose 7-phosphate kinase/D-beta-D-heptose 1-phosphate adenosyltransferase